jgi:hypothetical protein
MRIDADFGDLERKLNDLQKKIESLHDQQVPLVELLDPAFMIKHTEFSSLEEMLESGGFSASSQAEFESIPQEQLDEQVASHTEFASWSEMLIAAGTEWAARKLGFSE